MRTEEMLKLRPYQIDAASSLKEDLKTHKRIGLIMPTGGGKTVVFQDVSDDHLKKKGSGSVLILSDRDILTQQTYARIRATQSHLRVGIFQGQDLPHPMSDVVISTMQTSREELKIDKFKKRMIKQPSLIIVDEAHHIVTDSYQKILGYFEKVPVIGCTASPFAHGQLMTNFFDKISYSISLQELIDQGYLVPPELVQLLLDDRSTEGRMALVVKTYIEKERGKKAIVFMQTKDDCKALRNVFDANGVEARVITDEIVGEERASILRDYQYGDIDVLISVDVLTKGFDCDNVEALFMPFTINSPAQYIQRIGRALRKSERIDKNSARIYVVGDTPSIKKGFYKRLHELALSDGSVEISKKPTVFDELDWMMLSGQYTPEEYEWTQRVCDAVKKVRGMDLEGWARLLETKKFPKKFLKDISKVAAFVEKVEAGNTTITSQQVRLLKEQGFNPNDLAGLDKASASSLIATITNYQNRPAEFPFQLTVGKFSRRHVNEVPGLYKKWAYEKAKKGVREAIEYVRLHREYKRSTGEWQ